MQSFWNRISAVRWPAYDGPPPDEDALSAIGEAGEDETDGPSGWDQGEEEGPGEDSTEEPPKRRWGLLKRQPSRMKVCFDVGHASVRLQKMQRSRKRSSLHEFIKSLTGSEASMSAADEEEVKSMLSEKSFWHGDGDQLPPSLAEIAFDNGSTHYCIVSHKADPKALCEQVMLQEWGLANPKLILSIMGGAGLMNLDKEKFDIESFSKGLVEAALRTGAWVTSGGTKSGVMEVVGQAMKEHDKQRLVPCIGITPLGALKASWRSVLESGSQNNPKVDAPNAQAEVDMLHQLRAMDAPSEQVKAEEGLARLQESHTHSIICDNGVSGHDAFGSEAWLRAELEKYLGSRQDDNRSPGSSRAGGALRGTQVPRVMILVNGGSISLNFVLEFIERGCPVVVCRGTGRVADLIGSLVEKRSEEGFVFDEQYDLAVNEHMGTVMKQEDRVKTQKIVESGWVEVYTISKRLEDVVLRAVLGSPSTRTQQHAVGVRQQLMLAVQWGCTNYFDTLGRQLVQECGGERDGPAKAICIIFKELVNLWRCYCAADRQSEIPESSGALVAWLLKNHLKQMDAFEIEVLGGTDWQLLGPTGITKSLEAILLWCIEKEAPAAVLETIWMYMEDPVHAGLVAASACRETGISRFGTNSYSDTVAKANLDSVADRFERLAVLLLEELATTGKGVEYLFQESDRYCKYNCFRLAHHLGCRKFVSATFYRMAVDRYWRTPLPFSIKKKQLGNEYLKPWNLLGLFCNIWGRDFSLGELLSIPYIKCCTHGISRCAFIAIYSYAVFYGLTTRRGFLNVKLLLFLWGLGFGMVEVSQYRQTGSAWVYFSDFWNVLDASVIVSLLTALVLGWNLDDEHSDLTRTLEVIHALNLLPTWIRVGQVLQLDQELGTLFLTMGGMCKDALRFLVLVSIVCLGFSCALTPMLFKGEERENQGLLWAFWTIVGSIDEEALKKIHGEAPEEDNATAFNATLAKLDDGAGGILGPLTHVLFYTLVLVSNVLLVNLLIAVMNSTYERNMENSQTEWAFYRVQTVLEFDEWADLPPPLNLLELFLWAWPCRGQSDNDPDGELLRGKSLKFAKNDLLISKRDLKDSQQKAIATVGLEEDAGEIAVLRADNAALRQRNVELAKRKEELEGLAANFLIETGGLRPPNSSNLMVATFSNGLEHGLEHGLTGVRRYRTAPNFLMGLSENNHNNHTPLNAVESSTAELPATTPCSKPQKRPSSPAAASPGFNGCFARFLCLEACMQRTRRDYSPRQR